MDDKKAYVFTVKLSGFGDTVDTAWIDAIEAFNNDPGDYSTYEVDE